jgi:hypothetical protein
MNIALYGDSLTEGRAGVSYINLLQPLLPGHELLNYGRGGDTVISLYHRIAGQHGLGIGILTTLSKKSIMI